MRARNFRQVVGLIWLGVFVGVVGCSDDSALKFDAVAGEVCQDCEQCTSIVGSCICHTCTQYAVDTKRKQLLVCTGVWEVHKECPGGVSVSCAGDGYRVTCLDEDGQRI
jgi:hypothetical protein